MTRESTRACAQCAFSRFQPSPVAASAGGTKGLPMKLSLKLPLAFTVSLLLLLAAALFGISRLNQALDT